MTHDPQDPPAFPAFVRGMIDEGGSKLDDVLQNVYGARRQDLLAYYGRVGRRQVRIQADEPDAFIA